MGTLKYIGLTILVLVCLMLVGAGATHEKRSLLDTLLKRFFKDEKQEEVRSNVPRKQLIVTSFPGGKHEAYNAGELGPNWCDKINYFLFTYAMAAKNIGDEFMIFYPEGINKSCFDPALFACSNAYVLPMPPGCEMDIWMRDFTTINWNDPIHFKFEPKYLQGDGWKVEEDFLNAMDHFNLLAYPRWDTSQNLIRENTILALDGGNVVDCADKAIVSWRVEEENPRLRRPQIRRMIEEALPGKDVCFIRNPPYKEDTTGHADGVVSFLDKDTIILPDYGDEDDFNLRWDQIRACYPQSKYRNLKIVRMENYMDKREMKKETKAQSLLGMLRELISSDSDHQMSKREAVARFTSATGSTINLLASDLGLYVPSFASVKKENDKQFNVINANKGNKKIERVDTGEISFMGGSVRCMSWQMYADTEVALRLMNEATQPKNNYVPGVSCDLPVDQLFEQLK